MGCTYRYLHVLLIYVLYVSDVHVILVSVLYTSVPACSVYLCPVHIGPCMLYLFMCCTYRYLHVLLIYVLGMSEPARYTFMCAVHIGTRIYTGLFAVHNGSCMPYWFMCCTYRYLYTTLMYLLKCVRRIHQNSMRVLSGSSIQWFGIRFIQVFLFNTDVWYIWHMDPHFNTFTLSDNLKSTKLIWSDKHIYFIPRHNDTLSRLLDI